MIGDGGWYFTVADVASLPDYQRRGLGGQVLQHLLKQIAVRAPEDPYVTLVADSAAGRFYERAGFREVAPPHGVAMQMVLDRW